MNLKEYLIENCESGIEFSKRAKISIATVYKMLSGATVSTPIARKVIEATGKKVTSKDLLKLD
jgi:predicted transcriptional regulator